MPQREFFRRALSPEYTFLILGTICGLAFVFVTPPFQAPDEPQHFYRAYQISEFRLLDVVELKSDQPESAAGYRGTLLPKSLGVLVENSDLDVTRFQPFSKLIPSRISESIRIPLRADERVYLPVSGYPPAGYLFPAIGIALGRTLGLPPLVLLYLGRASALCGWLFLVFCAIRATPILKWVYFLLALMPMTVYLAASLSIDSFVIGVAFLLSATLLRWAFDEAKISVRGPDIAFVALLAVCLALSKAIYVPLVLLIAIVPARKFAHRRRWLVCVVLLLLTTATFWGWGLLARMPVEHGPVMDFGRYAIDVTIFPGVSPTEQLALLRANPMTLARVMTNTITLSGPGILHSFFGLLGWLDTVLPLWIPYAYVVVLILAGRASLSRVDIRASARLISAFIFAGSVLVIFALLYVTVNPVGALQVEHFQGRYLIPFAPVLLVLSHRNNFESRRRTLVASLLTVFVVAITWASIERVRARYYDGEGFTYRIDDTSMSSEGDAIKLTGWAIARNPDELAEAVEVELDGRFFPARYGLDRPDAETAFGDSAYRRSGFEAMIDASILSGPIGRAPELKIHTRGNRMFAARLPRIKAPSE